MPPKPKRRRGRGNESSDILHYNGQVELTFKNKTCNLDASSSDEDTFTIGSEPKALGKLELECSSDSSDNEIQIFTPNKTCANNLEEDEVVTLKKVVTDRPITPPPAQEISYVITKKTRDIAKNVNDKLRSLQQVTLEQVSTPPSLSSSSRLSDLIMIDSPTSQEHNRSFTLRIRTKNGIERFPMTMNGKFHGVLEQLAKKNNVSIATISLSFTDSSGVFQMLKSTDSPNMVNLNCADILDCVIVHPAEMSEESVDLEDNHVNIKIQGCDANLVKSFKVLKNKPLLRIMKEYALFCKVKLTNLKFYFDGDIIDGDESPESLDMDDENVIDVKII